MNWLPHNIILHHIRLLQLENYHLRRFFQVVRKRFFAHTAQPDITWTMKLYAVTILALLIQMEAAWQFALLFNISATLTILLAVLLFLMLSIVFFIFASIATLILWPIDQMLRSVIIWRAKSKLKSLPVQVVGITGSYGKTTMKETVATILSEELTVVKTEENKNTPLGISRTILSKLGEDTDVFVVEMGAYTRGDIRKLCKIAVPDISIVTGVNEAHLERFGSIENTIAAKFEIVEYAHPEASVIANADDERVVEHVGDFIQDNQELVFFSARNNKRSPFRTVEKTFNQDGSGLSFELMRGSERVGYLEVPHLADYIIGNIIAAFLAAEALGLQTEKVRSGVSQLRPTPHRLQVVSTKRGVIVIDDSYNGNPDGVHAAIETLSKFKDRRKIYVTPGLVEMGNRSQKIHRDIGRDLASAADQVVLIDTSVTPFIIEGLKEEGFKKGDIIHVDSTEEARMFLSGTVSEGDVVLFQNDWPENYV